MKNDRETVIYYEKKSPTTPTIFGGLWGWMETGQEDWGALENKIDNLCCEAYLSGDIGDFIYALKYVINSGEPIKDLDEKEFYEFLNKVEETKDPAFIEFADLYFERIKFLITDARKYATKEEIDECIEEEINNRKIV